MSVGVVVGASGGIGSACARMLDSSADVVILTSRSEARLRATAATLTGKVAAVVADIATEEGRNAIGRAVDEARSEIAWLILAAGAPLRRPLMQLQPNEIREALLTNFVAPVLLIRRLLDCPWLPNASIIAIGSITASRSLPNRSVYSGSKAGLEHFCRSLAAEVAPLKIRVNVVAPGVIETPFLGGDQHAIEGWIGARVPQKRAGTPDEVAAVVRYLALEAPSYVTGARIAVDGGAEASA